MSASPIQSRKLNLVLMLTSLTVAISTILMIRNWNNETFHVIEIHECGKDTKADVKSYRSVHDLGPEHE
jgi:hypothetical protein